MLKGAKDVGAIYHRLMQRQFAERNQLSNDLKSQPMKLENKG